MVFSHSEITLCLWKSSNIFLSEKPTLLIIIWCLTCDCQQFYSLGCSYLYSKTNIPFLQHIHFSNICLHTSSNTDSLLSEAKCCSLEQHCSMVTFHYKSLFYLLYICNFILFISDMSDPFARSDMISEFQTLVDLCPHPNIIQIMGVSEIQFHTSGICKLHACDCIC